LGLGTLRGWAQDQSSSPSDQDSSAAELAAIRAESDAFVAAFNKRDATAVAALWTEDGDFIDETGQRFAGREAIEKGYEQFFADHPRARIRILIDSLRLLSDSAAIEDGRTIVQPPPAGAPTIGNYTAVHIKVDGKWRLSTVRESTIETPSAYHQVADLEWLIGTWTAQEHGASSESTCRWIANKSFVQRSYKVTHADGSTITGVQIIGWNPRAGHVQSWNFSSDGGHAIGVWTPISGGWSAAIHGITGDGTPTVAVNVLTKLDDNAYVWQSMHRSAGGAPLPDTDEVVLKRQLNSN
jgi:uncharacterized protein (TIGR02246 family)